MHGDDYGGFQVSWELAQYQLGQSEAARAAARAPPGRGSDPGHQHSKLVTGRAPGTGAAARTPSRRVVTAR
eukprot:429473-Hanusia_phi.AAC.2